MSTREQKREWNRAWIAAHRAEYNAAKYRYRDALKIAAIFEYSNGAMCCGWCKYTDLRALVLDHINDDGAAHRKEAGYTPRSSGNFYEYLRKQGWPPGLQVLCANCNMIKEHMRKDRNRQENPFYAAPISAPPTSKGCS